jgi:hypothetical protein
MILSCKELYLEEFESEKEREDKIFEYINNDFIYEMLKCPIIDYDFSSCIHNTTLEDDVLSYKFHERTWDGNKPTAGALVWSNSPNAHRAGISFIIRFLRFGTRKAAYKLLHENTAAKRFKYDNPIYYFDKLPYFVGSLDDKLVKSYPTLFNFVSLVSSKLKSSSMQSDCFFDAGHGKNETLYVDVFPY